MEGTEGQQFIEARDLPAEFSEDVDQTPYADEDDAEEQA